MGSKLELVTSIASGGLLEGILIGRLEEVDVERWLWTLSLASIFVMLIVKSGLAFCVIIVVSSSFAAMAMVERVESLSE